MTKTTASDPIWKQLTWFLVAALVGLYMLYASYTDRLDARLADAAALSIEKDERMVVMQGEVGQLQARLESLRSMHGDELAQLADQLAATEQARAELAGALDELRKTDADLIAAEQAKTAAVISERDQGLAAYQALETQLDEARAVIASQQGQLDTLQKAIADSAVEHREQIQDLERHLNERLSLAKSTPKDADLIRAAQAAGLLPEVPGLDEETATLNARLTEMRNEIQAMRSLYDAAQADHRERMAAAQAELAETRAELDRLRVATAADPTQASQALTDAEARIAKLSEQLAQAPTQEAMTALQARLDQTTAELTTAKEAATASLEALKASHAEQLAAAEARIATLSEQLGQAPDADQLASFKQQQEADAQRIAALETERDALEQAADQVSAQARAEYERQVSDLEARLSDLSAQLGSARDTAKQMADEHLGVVDALKTELASARTDLDKARAELAAAGQTRSPGQPEEVQKAQARIAELETALAKERSAAKESEAALRLASEQSLTELRGLYARFAELGGTQTERGTLLKLAEGELRFPPGAATLPETELPSLDRIAALLSDYPRLEIQIEGHTDSVGNEARNLELSQQRAAAVREALIQRGVDGSRMSATGVGPERPIADNASPAGRAQNRRVEIYVSEAGSGAR